MYFDYGCDDIDYLLKKSKVPNSIQVFSHGKLFTLPTARLDNRIDKTSFVRDAKWKNENIASLKEALIKAIKPIVTDIMAKK